ncbi:MAG: OmpH family outer membrane protein [Ectothiorhodospiraceae bacterium]|jgi:outer membrane protein
MFTKIIKTMLVVVAAGLLLGGTASGKDLKIGFVNPGRVSSEAPQAEAARAKLEQEFEPRDKELVALQKDLRKLEDQLQRDGAVMDEAKKRRLEREIVTRKREIRRRQDEFRDDFNMRRNEELSNLQRRILKTVSEVARQEGFDLVVSDGVIYASEQIDITDRIIERLRDEYKRNQGEDQ